MNSTAGSRRPSFGRRLLATGGARSQLLIGMLAGLLGFALVVQVRTTQESSGLRTARQEDLVGVIDDLTARSQRLQEEISELQQARDRLASGTGRDAVALEQARRRADALAILAGTVPARGRGVVIVIDDPGHSVKASVLLDAVQELRDAGAEAMMINQLRVGASTYVLDTSVGIELDAAPLAQPYRISAIGEPATLEQAMGIPGGVVDVVEESGARITVSSEDDVVIDVLRPVSEPRYARPVQTS